MKKSIIISILTLVYLLINAQQVKKNIVYVNFFKENVKTKIYNNFNKDKVIDLIYDDSVEENSYTLEVWKVKSRMIKISGGSIIKNSADGWIEFSNIGIKTRPRNFVIQLYVEPNYKAKHIAVYQQDEVLVRVTAISSNWLKIILTDKKRTYNYWLPYEYQCWNPYTTCN